MKYLLIVLASVAAIATGMYAAAAFATDTPHATPHDTTTSHDDKITICHVAGLASDPANYITLTIAPAAVYGLGGHFNENGTPQAGHEQDTFGPCHPEPPPTTTHEEPTLPVGVTFTEATCTTGPSFQLVKTNTPLGPRPFYNVEGPLVNGKPVAGASYTITAIPVEGYVFEGQTVFTHTFAAAPTNCGTPPPRVCPDGKPPFPPEQAYDPNDDCKRPPPPTTTTPTVTTPPTTTTPTTTTPTTTTPTPTTPTATTPTPTVKPPKTLPPPKKTVTPKPPTTKTPKVCLPLKDGTERRWWKGGNGMKAGCYPIIEGSG